MKALDAIATAGVPRQTFFSLVIVLILFWYLRFLVRRHRRYNHFLCALLTKSTGCICFCAVLAQYISTTRLQLKSSGMPMRQRRSEPFSFLLIFALAV